MSRPRSLRPRPKGERIAPRPFHTAKSINPPAPLSNARGGGWRGRGPRIAPALAALVLVAAAASTLYVVNLVSPEGQQGGAQGPEVTEGVALPGTLAFARAGSIVGLSGSALVPLTSGGTDGEIAWSSDGTALYFVRHRDAVGGRRNPNGTYTHLKLVVPTLMRVGIRGGSESTLLDGLVPGAQSKYDTSAFIFGPAQSPTGELVVASDYKGGPGTAIIGSDVIIRSVGADGRTTAVGLPDQNGFSGEGSASRIVRYDIASATTQRVGDRGFVQPAPSPSGRWIAATRITAKGTDVVLLDAVTGTIVLEVTRSGRAWAPAWSPDGAQLAFLSAAGTKAALNVATIGSAAGQPTVATSLVVLRDPVDADVLPAWSPITAAPAPASGSATAP
jgi:dipeptidyl aminopeptidase/acylaminoacyl peptidase